MWRLLLIVLVFLVIALLGLLAYSYWGDLAPPNDRIEIPIEVDVD